jgi:hypothetical protein
MIEALSKGLQIMSVKNGIFLDDTSVIAGLFFAHQALPTTGKLNDQMLALIDHYPFIVFAKDRLATQVSETEEYKSEPESVALTSIVGFSDQDQIAKDLVGDFCSLPWEYTFTIQLPKEVTEILRADFSEFQISRNLRIVLDAKKLAQSFPKKSDNKRKQSRIDGSSLAGLLLSESEWSQESGYLQIGVTGYVDRYGSTAPAMNAIFAVRAFFGLAIALQLFDIEKEFSLHPASLEVFVHRKLSEAWELDGKFEINKSHATNISLLKFGARGKKNC